MTTQERRRWAIAIAVSIALNEIAIGLLHPSPPVTETHVEPTIVTIARRTPPPTPPPAPKPTPTPTPPPVVRVIPHATTLPHRQIAAPKSKAQKERTHGGSVSRHASPKVDVYAELSHSDRGQAQGETGTGTGLGSGAGNGGGEAGNAEGSGTGGNGTGDVNANAPCGFVELQPSGPPDFQGDQIAEVIVAIVHFPDGHVEQARFPYRWVYRHGERDDPWSSTNLRLHATTAFQIPLQPPPPGADVTSYSSTIQYILQHTTANGTTTLSPCPKPK